MSKWWVLVLVAAVAVEAAVSPTTSLPTPDTKVTTAVGGPADVLPSREAKEGKHTKLIALTVAGAVVVLGLAAATFLKLRASGEAPPPPAAAPPDRSPSSSPALPFLKVDPPPPPHPLSFHTHPPQEARVDSLFRTAPAP
eukprot:Sspe_Gene.104810::Locus_81864_Transcript_1_1_Confidence_1.000_Length_765::g.104810::m.104810